MLEELFKAAKANHELAHATRLARLYLSLRQAGLRIYHGWFAGYRYQKDKRGGFVTLCLGNDLYFHLGIYSPKDSRLECELMAGGTQDLLSLYNEGKGWKLMYVPDSRHPNPDIQRVAYKYRFPSDKTELSLEALQVRSFLREISILSDLSREESSPAHP